MSNIKQRIEVELRQIAGSTASGAQIHALLTDTFAEIERLEGLRKKGLGYQIACFASGLASGVWLVILSQRS